MRNFSRLFETTCQYAHCFQLRLPECLQERLPSIVGLMGRGRLQPMQDSLAEPAGTRRGFVTLCMLFTGHQVGVSLGHALSSLPQHPGTTPACSGPVI